MNEFVNNGGVTLSPEEISQIWEQYHVLEQKIETLEAKFQKKEASK